MDQSIERRLVIIGGGPVGIELAIRAQRLAHFSHITILEAGEKPLSHVRSWGHVRLFSPWALNTSEPGLAVLDEMGVPRFAL